MAAQERLTVHTAVSTEITARGWRYTFTHAGTACSLADALQGTAKAQDGRLVDLGVLQVLVSDDRAVVDALAIVVPHAEVAMLSQSAAASLDMPDRLPYRIRVRGEGTFADSAVRAVWWFEDQRGRPLVAERVGALVRLEGRTFLLHDPLFSFLERLESFNREPGSSLTERTARWGWVAQALPVDLRIDGFLGGVRVLCPSHCSVRLGRYGNQSVVVPVFESPDANDTLGERLSTLLTEQETRQFQQLFFGINTPLNAFPVGGGTYLVVPPELQPILGAIRTLAHATPEKQREFVLRPHGQLKARLDASAAAVVDAVVLDDGYSERVESIGPMPHRVVPWIKQPAQSWLPPEELGLRIGDEFVAIPPKDLPVLQEAMRAALLEHRETVTFADQVIAVTPEAVASVDALIGTIQPKRLESDRIVAGDDLPPKNVAVLIVTTNFDVVDYRASPRDIETAASAAVGDLVLGELLGHQVVGIGWLAKHWADGSPGCLLADDMGLGKTVQTLAFLRWIRDQRSRLSVLVVAPTGLLRNWEAEHAQWIRGPGLGQALSAYGYAIQELRIGSGKEMADGAPLLDTERLRAADWVLTSYETLRDYQHSFGRIKWDCLVLDEAQRLKHPDTGVTQAAKAMQASFTVALSGTPVENRYADLWSIVDAIQPGRLGSLKEFSRRFEKDVEASGPQLRQELTGGTPALMLRRLKDQILEGLPEKQIVQHRVTMPPAQASAYNGIVLRARGPATRGMMLKVIQELRNASLHPGTTPGNDSWMDDGTFVADSARLTKTLDILDEVFRRDAKALVFVEALELQGRLVGLLQRRYAMRRPPMVINGNVAGPDRLSRVNAFQRDQGFDVMLISPKAGGVGLTLTAATTVIHLSRWWNPAVEDQCTDRAYRLGQRRKVEVHLPLAIHPDLGNRSFDACLDALITRKRRLSNEILAAPTVLEAELEALYRDLIGQ